jgi:hypothetical protein
MEHTPHHRLLPAIALLLLLPALACDLEVVPNRDSVPSASAIHGTAFLDDAPAGDVYLMLYDCQTPPPPVGSGRPLDFVVVPQAAFDKDQAPFAFPLVEAGEVGSAGRCYLVTGFMDVDHDFNPFYGVTAQVTGGDVAATTVTVFVPGPAEEGAAVPLVEDVSVVLATEVPLDRPSFQITPTHESTGVAACGAELSGDPALGLTVGKDTDFALPNDVLCADVDALPLATALVDVEVPLFTLVFAADDNDDGLPDDLNGDTAPDVLWPQVLFLRLDPADENGLTTVEPPVVIPGIVLPQDLNDPTTDNHLLDYLTAGLPVDGETVYPVAHLNVMIPEVVVTDADAIPPVTTPLADVAQAVDVAGGYQVLIMNNTGQLWQTPNELGALGIPTQIQTLLVSP